MIRIEKKSTFITSIMTIFLMTLSCSPDTLKIKGLNFPQRSDNLRPPIITSVKLEDDAFVITGEHLDDVEQVIVTSSNIPNNLHINFQTAQKIITHAPFNLSFPLGEILSLTVSHAKASEVYRMTFELNEGSVKAVNLDHMGASDGDALVYNASAERWEPTPLSGLHYRGTWDADNAFCDLPEDFPSSGDYWIISQQGGCNLDGFDDWLEGDWAIWNGDEWQKISHTSGVSSFNGRQGAVEPQAGDYAWSDIDLTDSTLADLADIDASGALHGQVLKWDAGLWTFLVLTDTVLSST